MNLKDSDRRYSVWIQSRPLPPDVIAELQADKALGWPQVRYFLDSLLSRRILREFWRPYDNKARMMLMSIDSPQMFAEQIRDNGIRAMSSDWVLDRKSKLRRAEGDGAHNPVVWVGGGPEGVCFVPTKILSEMYRLWCSSYGHREVKVAGAVVSALLQHIPGTKEMLKRHDNNVARGIGGLPLEMAPVRLSDSVEVLQTPAPADDTEDWFGRANSKGWEA